jgi:pilus assembly protein Flp/PilA
MRTEREKMMKMLKTLVADDSGQDLIEYALVAALVGLGAIASMKGLANSLKNAFNGVGSALSNAV